MQRDRISELPDEVLGEILSSIPIKDAVKTSCMSKRWKSVWTSVHAVHIRELDWYGKSKEAHFANFVESVFNHVSALRKLELSCYVFSKQWIDIVTNKLYDHVVSLRELDLNLSYIMYPPVKLPPSIFTSKNLVVLKLDYFVAQQQLSSLLPSLKVLHLRKCIDVSCVENILAGCPVLEELSLNGVLYNEPNIERWCIKSSSLKSLKLYLYDFYESRIEIDASNLAELGLKFDHQTQIVIMNTSLPLLMRVTIRIEVDWDESPDIDDNGNRLIELLTKASTTKYLFLCSTAMAILEIGGFYQKLTMFKNLMDLNLDVWRFASWPILSGFLANSPNLVSFSLCKDDSWLRNQLHFCSTRPNFSVITTLHHLEKVELKKFEGSDDEMKLVSYILKKAPVLKKMTFYFAHPDKKAAAQLHSQMVKLPKASTACEVNGLFYDSMSELAD